MSTDSTHNAQSGGVIGVPRQHPLASAAALTIWACLALAAVVVLREWGLALLGVIVAAMALRVGVGPPARREARALEVLRGALVSGVVFLAVLAAGETWLRVHPEHVGGGGGGNPALSVLHAGLVQLNELGLRGPTPHNNPAPALRVVAVGDSFTYGQGVDEQSTWPAQLRDLLQQRMPEDARVEVVNGGNPGRDTRGEVDWLRRVGAEFAPDVVVLQFYANDLVPHRPPREAQQLAWHARLRSSARKNAWILFHLQDRFARWQRSRDGGAHDWMDVFQRHVETRSPAWRQVSEGLDDLALWSRETGTPVLVVLYAHPGSPHAATPIIHGAVQHHAAGAGLEVLDLAPHVGQLAPAQQIAASYDHHPSPALHGIAASRVADALIALGWVP